ncbi:MAG: HEPN domain-containing protein [Aphanizomenon gracile PMC627.10]|nr:HEPN domain-containing protein [Aphanizomenon gracile PMC638.10]MDM3850696.1 HEPN domain-containing protein [Aphanizomenon gracile PMC627.10]
MNNHEIMLLLDKSQNSHKASILLLENDFRDLAVGRVYYTMFYIAQAFLLSKNLSFSSHKAVISAFGREFCKNQDIPLKYHRFLIDAQVKRNEADYDISPNISLEEAHEMINNAEEMLNFSSQYFDRKNHENSSDQPI